MCCFNCECHFLFLQEVMSGSDSMPKMYADLFNQLLTFVEFAVKPPKFGKVDAKSVTLLKTAPVRVRLSRATV